MEGIQILKAILFVYHALLDLFVLMTQKTFWPQFNHVWKILLICAMEELQGSQIAKMVWTLLLHLVHFVLLESTVEVEWSQDRVQLVIFAILQILLLQIQIHPVKNVKWRSIVEWVMNSHWIVHLKLWVWLTNGVKHRIVRVANQGGFVNGILLTSINVQRENTVHQ